MFKLEDILLLIALFLLLGVLASKTSGRLGVPALVVFLAIGIIAGEEVLGFITFNDAWLAQTLGVVALCFILFSGGLDTDWKAVRPLFWRGLALSTFGVLFTALLVGLFSHFILGFEVLTALLLGAVVSSTDAAAVFSILKAKEVSLKPRLRYLLELESGSNDPMAVFLTTGIIYLILNPELAAWSLLPLFVFQMSLGFAVGYAIGLISPYAMNTLRLEYDGLYSVLTIAMVFLTYGLTTYLGGNGFLAVYVAGLLMSKSDYLHKRSISQFHDGLAWLMQIMMFITLGLLVNPSEIFAIGLAGLLVSLFLIVVGRPLSILVTLLPFRIPFREKIFVSWVGLRGAVPIILATMPLLSGIPEAETIFNIVFFIVITSVLIQGTTLVPMAAFFGLTTKEKTRVRSPLSFISDSNSKNDLKEYKVSAGAACIDKSIVELELPSGVLIVLISREGEYLVPSGGTILKEGDAIFALSKKKAVKRIEQIFGGVGR